MTTPETAQSARIATGRPFLDQHGRVAQLHGVGILEIDGRFYAWGEDKREGGTFSAVACYSSADLVEWRFEGESLSARDAESAEIGDPATEHGELATGRVVERPKVLRHPSGRYVMFLHIDSTDYGDARVGFATSTDPVGPYEYHGSERPLGNLSRDIGVYQEDGVGYLLSEDRDHGLHIYRLADDYLSVDSLVATTLKNDGSHGYESPALVLRDGLYYLFGSDLTGWACNDNQFSTARNLEGSWSEWQDFAPPGSATFDSQISAVLTVRGTERDAYIYLGDRWQQDALFGSPPVWLPLQLSDGRASLEWRDDWEIDVTTGLVR